MTFETLLQTLTAILAVLAIIWHQQRSINKLRDEIHSTRAEMNSNNDKLRDDMNSNNDKLRAEMAGIRTEAMGAIDKLRADLTGYRAEAMGAIDKLRADLTGYRAEAMGAIDKLRADLTGYRAEAMGAIENLRTEAMGAIENLRVLVTRNGERLARIEGHLGIGMSATATGPVTEEVRSGAGG